MAKKVTLVEPVSSLPEFAAMEIMKKEKVAAYARVSTDHEEQQSSLAAQTDYYRKKILANPEWEFVGIYADDGVSGITFNRREAFNRMMQDCRDGKITMILTKSISRFARNTVDSIKFIRELKALGIGVMFEKENIWTLDSKGEFLLTVMSSLAQEESRSISENITWGHRKRMADGNYSVAFSRFLGYDRGINGEFVVNDEEAKTIKRIFALTLQGYSSRAVCQRLEDDGVLAPGGQENWCQSTIIHICTNEKYKGDALLQKSFVPDFLTKKQQQNKGELPQYYVKGGHPAIIDQDLFDHIQEILTHRAEEASKFSGIDPYSDKFWCGACGDHYGLRPWHSVNHVWVCRSRSRKGHLCSNIHIHEYAFHVFVKEIMVDLLDNHSSVISECKKLINSYVTDEKRKAKAKAYTHKLINTPADDTVDGEEPLYIINSIVAFPDNRLKVETVDGQTFWHNCRQYSPARGWWPEKPAQHKKEQREKEPPIVADDGRPIPTDFPEHSTHLTAQQKEWIGILRQREKSYEEIAQIVKANVNTVKTYCRRNGIEKGSDSEYPRMLRVQYTECQNCKKKVMQIPGRKEKRFCSEECRNHWWNHNIDKSHGSTVEICTCLTCGAEFKAYSYKKRKYCSQNCYIQGRFGDEENDTRPAEG